MRKKKILRKVIEKVIRDGKVAVILCYEIIGWYSFHKIKELLFHPKLVELIEQRKKFEINFTLCKEILGDSFDLGLLEYYFKHYTSDCLYIEWIHEGTTFTTKIIVNEETIITTDDLDITI